MTTSPLTRTARKLGQAISRRLPKPREDSGLTTLEWLLIVAAVAGMAALAVVLVTNVISDTSEQVEGQSARKTAAELAATDIEDEAGDETWTAGNATEAGVEVGRVNDEYEDKCNRLRLIYGDVDDLEVTWSDGTAPTAAPWTEFATGDEPECNVT